MKRDSGYNTRQKEKLLDFLIKNKHKHNNVQEISAYLAEEGSPLGTATIYRQLDKLVDAGVVRKYSFDSKTGACYQYIDGGQACHEHFHLKCLSCGKLIHLDCDHLMSINQHIAQSHGFIIDPSQTVFYGKCADCAAAEGEEIPEHDGHSCGCGHCGD
ncbi:MAG: transcriptional repressor [Ruminococcus sp.]|nr:transcriptional repressor [Ruminococcus sp.]